MAKRNRPGFVETLRQGWKPAAKRPRSTSQAKGGASKPTSSKGATSGAAASNGAAPLEAGVGPPELLRRREELSKQFTELQWDLGGMTYEMASRDHFRLDVLARHSAKLQKVDSELGQIERVLKMAEAGAAGSCPACGALQARGAIFCWQCGKEQASPASPAEAKAVKASSSGAQALKDMVSRDKPPGGTEKA